MHASIFDLQSSVVSRAAVLPEAASIISPTLLARSTAKQHLLAFVGPTSNSSLTILAQGAVSETYSIGHRIAALQQDPWHADALLASARHPPAILRITIQFGGAVSMTALATHFRGGAPLADPNDIVVRSRDSTYARVYWTAASSICSLRLDAPPAENHGVDDEAQYRDGSTPLGLAIASDGSRLFATVAVPRSIRSGPLSSGGALHAFDLDAAHGHLSNRRELAASPQLCSFGTSLGGVAFRPDAAAPAAEDRAAVLKGSAGSLPHEGWGAMHDRHPWSDERGTLYVACGGYLVQYRTRDGRISARRMPSEVHDVEYDRLSDALYVAARMGLFRLSAVASTLAAPMPHAPPAPSHLPSRAPSAPHRQSNGPSTSSDGWIKGIVVTLSNAWHALGQFPLTPTTAAAAAAAGATSGCVLFILLQWLCYCVRHRKDRLLF